MGCLGGGLGGPGWVSVGSGAAPLPSRPWRPPSALLRRGPIPCRASWRCPPPALRAGNTLIPAVPSHAALSLLAAGQASGGRHLPRVWPPDGGAAAGGHQGQRAAPGPRPRPGRLLRAAAAPGAPAPLARLRGPADPAMCGSLARECCCCCAATAPPPPPPPPLLLLLPPPSKHARRPTRRPPTPRHGRRPRRRRGCTRWCCLRRTRRWPPGRRALASWTCRRTKSGEGWVPPRCLCCWLVYCLLRAGGASWTCPRTKSGARHASSSAPAACRASS